jgi:peroxiredoxin
VAFVAISSNDVSKFPLDGPEKMRERAQERGYPFPYLYDEEQSVARAYGATRTPEVFVFDQERLLVYHGAIDSDWEESSGMQHYLREALNRLLSGQQIYLPETPPVGCTIKWKS